MDGNCFRKRKSCSVQLLSDERCTSAGVVTFQTQKQFARGSSLPVRLPTTTLSLNWLLFPVRWTIEFCISAPSTKSSLDGQSVHQTHAKKQDFFRCSPPQQTISFKCTDVHIYTQQRLLRHSGTKRSRMKGQPQTEYIDVVFFKSCRKYELACISL